MQMLYSSNGKLNFKIELTVKSKLVVNATMHLVKLIRVQTHLLCLYENLTLNNFAYNTVLKIMCNMQY